MTIGSADYSSVVESCRDALGHGRPLTGAELRLVIDVVQHAANTLDYNASAATLETALGNAFTSLDAWTGVDAAADVVADIATQKAYLAPFRTAAAGGTAVTDLTVSDVLDGR